jgi:hypothetical protein
MKEAAELMSSMAKILWPLLFVGLIWYLRREIRGLIQPGTEFGLELFGNKLRIKPTRPPQDKSKLPPVEDRDQLPIDYIYLNHTSFLREEMQEEFRKRTGVQSPHYDVRVVVDSYYRDALNDVERVEYILHEAYPEPIQIRTRKQDKFMLKEVANGEYVLLAKVSLKGRKSPLVLQRYITLWKDGPRLK